MPQIIELPEGVELEVPDGLSQEQMGEVVDHYYATEGGQGKPVEAGFPGRGTSGPGDPSLLAGADPGATVAPSELVAGQGAGASPSPAESEGFSIWDYVPLANGLGGLSMTDAVFAAPDAYALALGNQSVLDPEARARREAIVEDVVVPGATLTLGAGAGAGMAFRAGLGRAAQVLASGGGAAAADTALQASEGEFDPTRAAGAFVGGGLGAAGGLAAKPIASVAKEGAKLGGLFAAGTAAEAVTGNPFIADMLVGGRLLGKSAHLRKLLGVTKKVTKKRIPKTQTSIKTDLTAALGAAGGAALADSSEGAP